MIKQTFLYQVFFLSFCLLFVAPALAQKKVPSGDKNSVLASGLTIPQGYQIVKASDYDGDQVPNEKDNCPFTKNKDQTDNNIDLVGDGCDIDQDGWPDIADNCKLIYNPKQLDENENKIGDVCEAIEQNIRHSFKKTTRASKKVLARLLKPEPLSETKVQDDFREFSDEFGYYVTSSNGGGEKKDESGLEWIIGQDAQGKDAAKELDAARAVRSGRSQRTP